MKFIPPRKQYRKDVDGDTSIKIERLHECERQIDTLQAQLHNLLDQHAKLLVQLQPYEVQRSTIEPSTINRLLPDELLQAIFEQVVIFPNHYSVGTLLLVCKRWHQLVMNHPKLWARIEILNERDLHDEYHGKKQISKNSYISACIERSQGLPLDILLDLGDVTTCAGWIQKELEAHTRSIADEGSVWTAISRLQDIGDGVTSSHYDKKYGPQLLEQMFNHPALHPTRWSSLELVILPVGDIYDNIFGHQLKLVYPLLKKLIIRSKFELPWSTRLWEMLGIANLNQVEELTIPAIVQLSYLSLSPERLSYLNVPFHGDLGELEEISVYSSLRILELGPWEDMDEEEDQPEFTIHLPCLTELRLRGICSALSKITWNLPALTTLHVSRIFKPYDLPRLFPRQIRWGQLYLDRFSREDINVDQMVEWLIYICIKSSSATLILPELTRATALARVMEDTQKGEIPIAELIFEENGNETSRFAPSSIWDCSWLER